MHLGDALAPRVVLAHCVHGDCHVGVLLSVEGHQPGHVHVVDGCRAGGQRKEKNH